MTYLGKYTDFKQRSVSLSLGASDIDWQIILEFGDIVKQIIKREQDNSTASILAESFINDGTFSIMEATYERWVDHISNIIHQGSDTPILERLKNSSDWEMLSEANDAVPTEDELHIADNKKFQDAKHEHPTFWSKISNSMKRGLKAGWVKVNDIINLLKDPMKILSELKDEFVHAYNALWEHAKKYVEKVGMKLAKRVEKSDKCPVVGKDDMKVEPNWFKEVWLWIPKFVKELVQKLIGAATKGVKKELKESSEPLGVILSVDRIMQHIPDISEAEDAAQLDFVNNMAKTDAGFVKWYQEKMEHLSNLIKNATNGMILYVGRAIENLGGPKALEGYPLSTAIIAIVIELAADTMFGANTWALDIRKLILTGAKHLVTLFVAPISWLYHLIQGAKILLTIEHIIHYLHGVHGKDAH